jgi:opacity protein-like surface antigen
MAGLETMVAPGAGRGKKAFKEIAMKRTFLALLLLMPLLPAAAAAQVYRFEITPSAGYRFDGRVSAYDDFGNRIDNRNRDLRLDESGTYGVTLDVPLAYSLQLELLANHQSSRFSLDRGLFSGEQRLGDVDLDFYQIGLLYQWGRGQVNPYFAGSLGVARLQPKFAESDSRFAGSLAGGAKIFFNRNVGLRLEVRGYYTSLDTSYQNVDDRGLRYRTRVSQGLYQGEGSAGIIFAW